MQYNRGIETPYCWGPAPLAVHTNCSRVSANDSEGTWLHRPSPAVALASSPSSPALRRALCVSVRATSLQSRPIPCNPVDWSLPGSSVHGILQARILEWVAVSSSRGNLPNPGIKPASPTSNLHWQSRSLTLAPLWHSRQASGFWYNFWIHWFSCDSIARQGGSL